ncbi:MAG TPA: lysophospholipid acyltransferase family protein [Steroidobacteraceae bacterium]|nr:lysophospholipid acyltransferase family protein [Steroidobacteraceae bacterium]
MPLIGSVVFTAFLFAWTLVAAIFFVVWAPFVPFARRFGFARFWGTVLLGALKRLCRLDYLVEGREHLPQGAHVALWKHSSSWETLAMSVVFPRQVWVLKRELQWIPFVGWAIKLLHAIAIDRSSGRVAVAQVVAQGKQRLAEGDWVMVFPEGTRMAPGETRRYGVSGALLAASAGALVVPVAHNAGWFWPRRGLLKKPGQVRVVIGPPIEAAGRDPREINEEAQRWIESQVARLVAAAQMSSPVALKRRGSPPTARSSR